MRGFLDRLYLISGYLGALFLVAIFGVVLAQVGANVLDVLVHAMTGRYWGFVVPSYADFAGFFLVGGTFLALAHTFQEGGHIRVGLLLQALPPPLKRGADILSTGAALVLSALLSWYSWALVLESWSYGDTSSGLVSVPLFLPQSTMALGATTFTIGLLDTLVFLIRGGAPLATRLSSADDLTRED
ncbi:TRAP transporter small permease [Rhodospirillum sp. A1_3_36]|uniref:TRAP transporter small permease n=1 Tax=Rhodospirillum sp. A1_3_36 TaxID=3391666 RepID=UPI0039A6880F